MNYVFPAALMANTFSVTGLMIILGLAGKPAAAADFGIVHGATVALLFSFSANARSIILNPASSIAAGTVLGTRMLLLIPLGMLSLLLSTHLAGVGIALAVILVIRRCAEWIAEVHVSEMELKRENRQATRFLASQSVLFLIAAAWLAADLPFWLPVLLLWATSPAWFSLGFVLQRTDVRSIIHGRWLQLLPHFGSTAIIGISVYVFRLLILLLVGKSVAGDFYTAFAIGGLLGSVFAQAIGPTLALQQARGDAAGLPPRVRITLAAATVCGLCMYAVAAAIPESFVFTGKSGLFWQATGLSLFGGAIMVIAQQFRLHILQHYANHDVFGPDVLMNILIVAAVPYVFYLLGSEALVALYLLNATLALLFYYSAEKSIQTWTGTIGAPATHLKTAIALLLFLPLFIQLNGAVFRETTYFFDTGGQLMRLPVPVSVLACYGGILLLGRYARAQLSLTAIFATFALMLVSSVLLVHVQAGQEQAKMILLIQFVLPMFALVLGQLYDDDGSALPLLATCLLWVLAILVPIQLLFTWSLGVLTLSPYLQLFSIYQHLQYVPVIFVSAYLLALYTLWESPRYRMLLLALGAPMGIYAGASISALTTTCLITGVTGFAIFAWRRGKQFKSALALAAAIVVFSIGYFSLASGQIGGKYDLIRLQTDTTVLAPKNLAQRLAYWKFYSGEILASPKTAVLGHAAPPDRIKYPSAHNYYLDFAYNFGLVPLLPVLGLIGLTLFGVHRKWREIRESAPLLGLTFVVLFLILVDNSFKVGMRQPYPGILTFFLWGVLLSHLFSPSAAADGRKPAPPESSP